MSPVCFVAGKMTRSELEIRTSRPSASIIVSFFAIDHESGERVPAVSDAPSLFVIRLSCRRVALRNKVLCGRVTLRCKVTEEVLP